MTVWISLFSFFTICAIVFLFACTYYIDKDVSTTNLRVSELQNSVDNNAKNLAETISNELKTSELCSNALKVEQEKRIKIELDLSELERRVEKLEADEERHISNHDIAILNAEQRIRELEEKIETIFVIDDEQISTDEPTKVDTETVVMEPVNETKKEETVKKSTPKKTSNKSTVKKKPTQSTKKA